VLLVAAIVDARFWGGLYGADLAILGVFFGYWLIRFAISLRAGWKQHDDGDGQ
jgi:hypothetical protein